MYCIALHHAILNTLQYTPYNLVTLHYTTQHYTTQNNKTLHYTTRHYTTQNNTTHIMILYNTTRTILLLIFILYVRTVRTISSASIVRSAKALSKTIPKSIKTKSENSKKEIVTNVRNWKIIPCKIEKIIKRRKKEEENRTKLSTKSAKNKNIRNVSIFFQSMPNYQFFRLPSRTFKT